MELSNICRLCLKIDKNIHCIFSINNKEWIETDISEIIYDCTKVKVTINDSTTALCIACFKIILSILTFRRRCQRADKFLKSRYKNQHNNMLLTITEIENFLKKTQDNLDPDLCTFLDTNVDQDFVELNSLWTKNMSCNDEINVPLQLATDDPNTDNESKKSLPCVAKEDAQDTDDKCDKTETNSENSQSKNRPKVLKGNKQTQKHQDDWPKLKKRDLVETKAYRGLCHLCGKEYQHLWVHLQSHSKVPTETCDICGKGFRSKANLSLHILLHKDADMPCEICGKKYRTKMRLKRHMRVHNNHRPFFCNICQKRFYTKYNLEVHSRMHSGERPFSCKSCNERFAHSYALKHHIQKVHKNESTK